MDKEFVTTWMDLEGIMLSEISQTEKDKYYKISFICGILKNKKLIDTEKRLVVATGRVWRVCKMGERWSKRTNFQL